MINNDCNHKLCQLLKSPKVKLVKILNKAIITFLMVKMSHTLTQELTDCSPSSSNSASVKYFQVLMQAIVAYILI